MMPEPPPAAGTSRDTRLRKLVRVWGGSDAVTVNGAGGEERDILVAQW